MQPFRKSEIMDTIKLVENKLVKSNEFVKFSAGDNISVSYKIVEGAKERIQIFKGDVIKVRGAGSNKMFTVRKMSGNYGVERIFPYSSPNIVEIKLNKRGKVRRAKLYYLRELVGKKAKIKEKKQGAK